MMLILTWYFLIIMRLLPHKKKDVKVRLSQNECMKSSIFQNSNWKIWRISALASKMGQIKKINALYYIKYPLITNLITN